MTAIPSCHYCGVEPGVTRDHIVARCRGGADEDWNIVPACASCNSRKGSRRPTCRCEKCVSAEARHQEARRGARRASCDEARATRALYAAWEAAALVRGGERRARGNATDYFDDLMRRRQSE